MRVPFVNLEREHAALGSELELAFRTLLATGRFVLGPAVDDFERRAARFLGVRHAIGVSCASDALVIALQAAGVRPGDEVVTSPFSFFATAGSILRVGARPRFVDVEPGTLNLDPRGLDDAISPRTRAVLPVHLFGVPARMKEILEIAGAHGVPVVEDAAQAFGSRSGQRAAGTHGALGCFSFFPTKVLGAIGDAGLVVTEDDQLAERCRRSRRHGATAAGEYVEVGGNYRMDAVQAAILSVKIEYVGQWIALRRAHARAYDDALGSLHGVSLLEHGDPSSWNGAGYTIRVHEGRRDVLRAHLEARAIETFVYYPSPIHRQPAIASLGLDPVDLPESELAAREVLSLPVHPLMTDAERDSVIDAVRAFFASA